MIDFDDGLLEDPEALARADAPLRRIASTGARVRVEAAAAQSALRDLGTERPRAVIAIGPEARFVRAVLEPTCPVPFVAWPGHALPAWVGPLDVVVALASTGADEDTIGVVREAVRRGARLVLAAPEGSVVSEHAAGRFSTLIPTTTADPQAASFAMLIALHALGLGPAVIPDRVAAALDSVAELCAPRLDLAHNPAKDVAVALADTLPLVWGGSVLAARASRRVAEALRAASGRAALAGEFDDLLPIIEATPPRDPFADPADEVVVRPCLLILDDADPEPAAARARAALVATAARRDVRVARLEALSGGIVERYASLVSEGMFAAVYLGIGLGVGRPEEGA